MRFRWVPTRRSRSDGRRQASGPACPPESKRPVEPPARSGGLTCAPMCFLSSSLAIDNRNLSVASESWPISVGRLSDTRPCHGDVDSRTVIPHSAFANVDCRSDFSSTLRVPDVASDHFLLSGLRSVWTAICSREVTTHRAYPRNGPMSKEPSRSEQFKLLTLINTSRPCPLTGHTSNPVSAQSLARHLPTN